MRIQLAQRFRPFSHTPGMTCVLPGTPFSFRIFPAKIEVRDISSAHPRVVQEIGFSLSGPVQNFTVQSDLEKGRIQVFGIYKEGYIRYQILPDSHGQEAVLHLVKGPKFEIITARGKEPLLPQQTLSLAVSDKEAFFKKEAVSCPEKLFLGCHKAQDWDVVNRRGDLSEILPFWYLLGQMVEAPAVPLGEGAACLLKELAQVIEDKRKLAVEEALLNLYKAGFEGILSPRLEDDAFQGFHLPPLHASSALSPLVLLKEGAERIRQLFIRQESSHIAILPLLPPVFHAGRLVNCSIANAGTLDIEWSKKKIRRMVLTASRPCNVRFAFQKEIKECRVRRSLKDRGTICRIDDLLAVDCQEKVFFDNFTK